MRAFGPFIFSAALAVFGATAANAALVISKAPTSNVICAAGVCTASAADAVLNIKDVKQFLKAGDLKIVSGGAAQDIAFNAVLNWTKPHRLTLDAYRSITFTWPVTAEGTGAVTLITNDGGTGGDYSFTDKGKIAFWDLSSSLIINGTSFTLVGNIHTLASDIASNIYGAFALARGYDASVDGTYKTSAIPTFSGIFDGLGHAIENLSIHGHRRHSRIGMFGWSDGTLRDIRLSVHVTDGGDGRYVLMGGLAGISGGEILQSSVTGTVIGGEGATVGGIAGSAGGITMRCNATVRVRGGLRVGGLFGELSGIVSQSWGAGTVKGDGLSGGLAGLVNSSYGQITQSYSTASVIGLVGNSYAGAGGLAGGVGDYDASTVNASYAIGLVSAPAPTLSGGFVGTDQTRPSGIMTSYWDMDTSGVSNPAQGAGNVANDPGITGLTDAALKSALPSGFDPAVWGQSAGINNGYPYLFANPPLE
jgi:hypothetical protein